MNRHIWKTYYNRNIGVLQNSDYILMRESLEKYLDHIRELDIDNYDEIEQLKLMFIRLDHHIDRLR
ncbi:hypothetical protein EXU28_18920 [Acinetobacter wuhouensis]|uniref:Uncharacterized protein n=1 Tax=Acinetobacter wuhouensis TaxID=1879050 RepID=A0A4Q7AC58_9GAMM|nr:hypothetical protein EXU28_18920 [Acinetobacter wuhouensis]